MVPYSLPNGLRNRLFTDIGVEMVAYYDFATIKRKLTYGSNPDEGYVTGHVNYCEKIKNILKKIIFQIFTLHGIHLTHCIH